ncbi:hypothetical protein ACFQX4_26855 [Roseomonas sp. GCM10028921]
MMTSTAAPVQASSEHENPGTALPGGFRSEEALRWAHVLTRMGVTCDPQDEPASYHLMPDFGDWDGTAFYCGLFAWPNWPPCYLISACALIATTQFTRVVFLGDMAAPDPAISMISRPAGDFAHLRLPFLASAQRELAFRQARGGHAAALGTRYGQDAVIGRVLRPGELPGVRRSARGVRQLLAEARYLPVGQLLQARAAVSEDPA